MYVFCCFQVPVPVKEIIKVPYIVPQPYEVIKKVPYEVKVPVPRPYEVKVPVPQPYTVEKKIPVAVKVPVPQPYTVYKKVPYPVKVGIFSEKKKMHYKLLCLGFFDFNTKIQACLKRGKFKISIVLNLKIQTCANN